ncbi:AAA family ATPase [Roseivirga sp.]|uniref:AAA family ATPase n=1 Tax=Roseivirga sp. TaxID=1964215 RepID=UPI002B26AF12|nr:AAA family ATPase [Roseivirga sp.]
MSQSLRQIAESLRDAQNIIRAKDAQNSDVKVQLIYAFNGSGKTRLSREFKELIAPKEEETEIRALYYNAFTEDLFYWDNDLDADTNRKLIIRPNNFTSLVLKDLGQEPNIVEKFQHYTSDKLTPSFNEEYTAKNERGEDVTIPAYSEVTFSIDRGGNNNIPNAKISKGEESNFIWCVFYSLLDQVIEALNTVDIDDRVTDKFNNLEHVFIDDPVSSLDDSHLIELAVNIAKLIKSSQSELKFIITTHNPLFFNVLYNEFKKPKFKKYILSSLEDGGFELINHNNDSPFAYHLHVFSILRDIAINENIEKYHFHLLRNVLEKTSTFLNYEYWGDLIRKTPLGDETLYVERILNITSHSKHSGEESGIIEESDKRIFKRILKDIIETFNFNIDTSRINI